MSGMHPSPRVLSSSYVYRYDIVCTRVFYLWVCAVCWLCVCV